MNKQYGINLIKNIDKYCSKKGITRNDFARQLNLNYGTVRTEYRVDDFQINDDGTVTIYRSPENEFVTFPFLDITRTFPHKQLSADELKTFRKRKFAGRMNNSLNFKFNDIN